MDQYASMFGKKDCALFLDCKTMEAEVIPIQNKGYTLLLVDTKVKHSLANSAYNERREVCKMVAQQLDVPSLRELDLQTLHKNKMQFTENTFQKALFVLEENARVLNAVAALKRNDFKALGSLLFESHKGLQHQYKVSCKELDFLVEVARDSKDVLGARMMGGGFGGCTLNLIKRNKVDSFVQLANEKYTARFNHSTTSYQVSLSEGSRLIP
jgi:galactokinase